MENLYTKDKEIYKERTDNMQEIIKATNLTLYEQQNITIICIYGTIKETT